MRCQYYSFWGEWKVESRKKRRRIEDGGPGESRMSNVEGRGIVTITRIHKPHFL